MPVKLLLDEHLRGPAWHALVRARETRYPELVVTCVGEPVDLPLSTPDEAILDWADRNGFLLISSDFRTMPGHFAARLASGKRSSGVLLVRSDRGLHDTLEYLLAVALCSDPHEWIDRFETSS